MDPLATTLSVNKVAKTLEAVIPAIVHRENRPELGAAPEPEAQATNIGETTLITSSGKRRRKSVTLFKKVTLLAHTQPLSLFLSPTMKTNEGEDDDEDLKIIKTKKGEIITHTHIN